MAVSIANRAYDTAMKIVRDLPWTRRTEFVSIAVESAMCDLAQEMRRQHRDQLAAKDEEIKALTESLRCAKEDSADLLKQRDSAVRNNHFLLHRMREIRRVVHSQPLPSEMKLQGSSGVSEPIGLIQIGKEIAQMREIPVGKEASQNLEHPGN